MRTQAALLAVLSVACGGNGAAPQSHARPNILVIDIDTFRADHLGAIREGRPVTPALDALAARGTRFTNAYSQSGWTIPALVSNLTGTLPVVIAAEDGEVAWRPAGTRDLAEIVAMYGYSTAAFWGTTIPGTMAAAISPAFQTNSVHQGKLSSPPTHEVTEYLADRPVEPFFAFVHDIDLHHPTAYMTEDGRVPFDNRSIPRGVSNYQAIFDRVRTSDGDEIAAQTMLARYDGVIHLYDAAVGRILAALEDAGLADHTVVVVTSDHGEDFVEHSVAEHGLLYDTTLHVPLIVADPAAPGGRTVDVVVQSVDLAPTLLARAGIPVDRSMDGRSYLSLLGGTGEAGEAPYTERPVFSLTEACHVSLRTRTAKLILRDTRLHADRRWQPVGGKNNVVVTLGAFADAHDLGNALLADCSGITAPADAVTHTERGPGPEELAIELYDLTTDPGELANLVSVQPQLAQELLGPLLRTLADRRRALAGAQKETMTPATVRAMKEQGYWGLLQPGGGAGTGSGGRR